MNVLIAKHNQQLFEKLLPTKKFNFVEASVNTITLEISEKDFIKLRDAIRAKGYNAYSIMNW